MAETDNFLRVKNYVQGKKCFYCPLNKNLTEKWNDNEVSEKLYTLSENKYVPSHKCPINVTPNLKVSDCQTNCS